MSKHHTDQSGAGTFTTRDTPVGEFTIVCDAEGRLLASGWTTDVDRLVSFIHPTLRPATVSESKRDTAVTRALDAYLEGDVTAIDGVPVHQQASEFRERAWQALREVPAGDTVSYGEFALMCGSPGAARAAGTACGTNTAALFVPCHRVLRSDGSLGGFGWGVDVKRWLLEHEAANA